MEDLTKRQQDVLEFIKKYIATHGYPPTVREICKGLNLSSPATVQKHIKNLEQLGYLKNESKKFRTIELLVDNEYLKKEPSDGYSIHLFTLQNKNKKLEERINKAIEYNYELQERYCHSALFDDLVASKIYEITEKQLNILQGEDKDE